MVAGLTLMAPTVISIPSELKILNQIYHVGSAITEIVKNLNEKYLITIDVVVFGHDKQLHFLAQEVIKKFARRTFVINFEQKSHGEKLLSKCGQSPKIILASHELEIDRNVHRKGEDNQFYEYHDVVVIFYYLRSNMTVYARTLNKLTPNIRPRALFMVIQQTEVQVILICMDMSSI